jgi:hypothetical protein
VKLLMINSVGEYVAGQEYEIEDAEADRFVILGYATGELSRSYSDDERDAFHGVHQRVSL